MLKELHKPESLLTFVMDRPGHDLRYAIDPTKIHRELGWLPDTSFEEGIARLSAGIWIIALGGRIFWLGIIGNIMSACMETEGQYMRVLITWVKWHLGLDMFREFRSMNIGLQGVDMQIRPD